MKRASGGFISYCIKYEEIGLTVYHRVLLKVQFEDLQEVVTPIAQVRLACHVYRQPLS